MNGSKNQLCKYIDCFVVDSSHLNLTFLSSQSYRQINIISMAFVIPLQTSLPWNIPSGEEWIIMFILGLLEYSSSILYQHSTDIVRSKCPLMARVRYIGVRAGGARGAAAPPQSLGNSDFLGSKRKLGQSQFLKTFPCFLLLLYFEDTNIFYFNQKSA